MPTGAAPVKSHNGKCPAGYAYDPGTTYCFPVITKNKSVIGSAGDAVRSALTGGVQSAIGANVPQGFGIRFAEGAVGVILIAVGALAVFNRKPDTIVKTAKKVAKWVPK